MTGAANLDFPGDTAATLIKGTLSGTANPFHCTWPNGLSAGVAYGIHFDASNTEAVGQYAPISL